MSNPLLSVSQLSKSYGPNLVLSGVSFSVERGQVVSVIGENGAGKSTLAKILAGAIRPDSGRIELGGAEVDFHSPRDALRHGIAFIPQELAYLPNLSVAENILIGSWPSSFGITSHREIRRRAQEHAQRFGIDVSMHRPMASLKLGERQLVEIVKALSRQASLILLDEPTASLTEQESQSLFRVLKTLTAEGVGILYISHRMDEVFRFSDRVDVLRNGRLVASLPPARTTQAELIEHMLGQAAGQIAETASAARGDREPTLRLVDWTSQGLPSLAGVSLEVAAGEIVGLFGLRGSGGETIAEGLAGLQRGIKGELYLSGQRRPIFTTPRAARAAKISYVPAERKREGLILTLPIQANLSLLVLRQLQRLGILRARQERRIGLGLAERLNLRYRSMSQLTAELSGGNQQKVMVGSRLAARPEVFVLQEPTRGVDVGARVELHRFLRELAAGGAAILLVTSDVEEAVTVSDRLLVMSDGAVAAELVGPAKTQRQALALAAKEAA